MIRLFLLLLCALYFSTFAIAETEKRLVLVTSVNSNISQLSTKELKRIYIGLSLKQNNQKIKPIRNHSDSFAHEVFLQNVIIMSSRIYERQLTTRALRKGSKRPDSESSHAKLVAHLNRETNSISYMWEHKALSDDSIRVIQPLWAASQ